MNAWIKNYLTLEILTLFNLFMIDEDDVNMIDEKQIDIVMH